MSESKTTKKNINYMVGIYADSLVDQKMHNVGYDIATRMHNFLSTKSSTEIQAMKDRVINTSETPPKFDIGEPISVSQQKYEQRSKKLPIYEDILKILG